MIFKFTADQLQSIRVVHDLYGPTAAYAVVLGRSRTEVEDIPQQEVEDFEVAFANVYNAEFGVTY
jgi:hypothetical protein